MEEFKPNQVRLDEFNQLALDTQLAVLNVVCEVYAIQTKCPSTNAVAYLAHLAQKLHKNAQPYVFTVYLSIWNK